MTIICVPFCACGKTPDEHDECWTEACSQYAQNVDCTHVCDEDYKGEGEQE